LRWLQEHELSVLKKARSALRAKDWVFLCMTGKASTDETDASFTYFDIKNRSYHTGLLELLGISHLASMLPEALPSSRNRAELLPAEAARTGLIPGTPVVSGPFDVSASDLGIGAIQPGDACTILGTAGIHQIILDKPEFTPENIGYNMCHAPADRWVRLLPTMSGTLNLQWFVKEFFQEEFERSKLHGDNPWDRLEELAGTVSPGANGILYHPYIDPAGERAPFVLPSARAQFFGLSIHCTREALLRAVYEGVVLSALDCYSLMPAKVSHLKLGGGGSQSDFWAQMFADALGCPVSVMQGKEFGACGAAINAGLSVGIFSSYEDGISKMVHPMKHYAPDAAKTQVYKSMHCLYRQIYQTTFPLWESATELSERLKQESPQL
jgi:sugar (pentulose or hexulose) kinase